jgi:hypothetical protein
MHGIVVPVFNLAAESEVTRTMYPVRLPVPF